jgi:L-lactate dehydrogenase complex protein LldG
MNSRQTILQELKGQIVPKADLPEVVDGNWVVYPDPVDKFAEMVKFAGGACHVVSDIQQIGDQLSQWPEFQSAKHVFSTVEGIPGSIDVQQVNHSHDLDNLDFVIYPGEIAVAENGAVWITDRSLKHRVVFFITQFLALVVRRETIVSNMHQAYQRIQIPQPGFGLFLAGPSKTADIEQSLVIGAHGCREMQVFVI